ncbi:MAG: ABC transporter permease [Burkholderiaceae bacterium]
MSAWRVTMLVFAKELRDALRDRRTLLLVLLSSVALGPLMLVALSGLLGQLEKQAEAREVEVVGLERAPTLANYLARQTLVARTPPPDWEAQLRDNRFSEPVVIVPPDFEVALAHGEAPVLQLVFSSANTGSQGGVRRVQAALQGFDQEQGRLRLIARGVAPGVLNAVQVDIHDIADIAARAAQFTGMLPFLVMMAVVYGALNAAQDTTAGERERGSLEPLLATPAGRTALVVGKWAAVSCVGVMIAVLSCLSFIPAQHLLRSDSFAALIRFGWGEAAWFIALLIPLAAAAAALMMAIAVRCRTVKEAQATNAILITLLTLSSISQLMGGQHGEASWQLWVPAAAQLALMDRVLKGTPIGIADIVPMVAVCAAVTLAAVGYVSHQLAKRAAQ